jgi:hypothetical protein
LSFQRLWRGHPNPIHLVEANLFEPVIVKLRGAQLSGSPMATSSFRKTAVLCQGGSVTRAVQNANEHDLSFVIQIVDGVIAGKAHTQARREILARGRGERKITQRLAILFDAVDKTRCGRLGSFASDIEPNFSEVGFGLLG